MHAHNFQDLTGKVFGYYTVLHEAPSRIQPNGNHVTMWTCRCICGKIKDVASNHLKSRPNISCGCMKRTTLEDLTGKIYNSLLVESRAESTQRTKSNPKKMRTMWNCRCLICGKKKVLAASTLKSGVQKSCGCLEGLLKSKAHLNDLTGKTVGDLLIDSKADDYVKPNGAHVTQWNCVCKCGTECIKSTEYLRKSPHPSCGCWDREQKSLRTSKNIPFGEIYGYLMVLERIGTYRTSGNNPKPLYSCVCLLCGSSTTATRDALVNGVKKSCGCLISEGELKVRQLLNAKKIRYESGFSFPDLLSDKGNPLLFDICVFENETIAYLIEYQGIQHYKVSGDGSFGRQQREVTDKQKKEYCKLHNIELYEIRYDEDIETRINEIITAHANFVPSSSKEEKV